MAALCRPAPGARCPPTLSGVLDVLALAAAVLAGLLALLMTVGLDQEGHSGRPWKSWFGLVLLVSTGASAFAVVRLLGDGGSGWLAVTALPPLAMLVLLVLDRHALWGNFPPSAPMRWLQRAGIVLVFALPGLLAAAAS